HNLQLLQVMVVLLFVGPACGQKKEEQEKRSNPFQLLYMVDPYRQHVADSLKYLIPQLDSILESDQYYRYGTVNNPKGKEAEEKAMETFMQHKKEVRQADSV